MDTDNFSKQMDLMGQIEALLKVEMHVQAELKILYAELAKLKENQLMDMDGVDDRREEAKP